MCMYVVYIYFHVQEYSFCLSQQGLFVALACTKHGSRSLDAIWNAATLQQKILIMEELSTKEHILISDQYGSILSSNYCLSLYKHAPNEWQDLQEKEFLKKKLFVDIIGDSKKWSWNTMWYTVFKTQTTIFILEGTVLFLVLPFSSVSDFFGIY